MMVAREEAVPEGASAGDPGSGVDMPAEDDLRLG
jgi:hypothetical protein